MRIEMDNTRRATMAQCARKYFYRWEMELVPMRGSTPLRYGGTVHAGLERYYQGIRAGIAPWHISIDNCLNEMSEEWAKLSGAFEFDDDFRTLDTAKRCVHEYIKSVKDDSMEIIEVEAPFTITMSDNLTFIGRVDGLVEVDGRTFVIEHKTTTSPMETAARLLSRSAQTMGYTWAARQQYPDKIISGCLTNILRTPLKKARKDGTYKAIEDKDFEFKRFAQIYTDADLINWNISIIEKANRVTDGRHCNHWPMEFDSCQDFSRPCEYMSLCEQNVVNSSLLNTAGFTEHRWDPRD